jgi:hypothetical protein
VEMKNNKPLRMKACNIHVFYGLPTAKDIQFIHEHTVSLRNFVHVDINRPCLLRLTHRTYARARSTLQIVFIAKVHHRTHNSPLPVPVLSQSNPIHTPQANLPKIHSDPILLLTPWSSKCSLSFGISHQNRVQFSLLSHACHMPRRPHSP